MSHKLKKIAEQLMESDKKVQLIYGFNGSGKTRLSRAFKKLLTPKTEEKPEDRIKVFYYNAFTEDLFYWDNDLEGDTHRKLIIRPNQYTQWVLKDEGQEPNIIEKFQNYTSKKLMPEFSSNFSEVTFSFKRGNNEPNNIVKISKGEESNFIWCIFYSMLEQIISVLNETVTENRETDEYNQLEFVFIDDPVTSLDENHLIELAVDLANLIKGSNYKDKQGIKFIITTHNPLFYNVLFNELNNDLYEEQPNKDRKKDRKNIYQRRQSIKYRLDRKEDGTCSLEESNDRPFSYHLFLLSQLKQAFESSQISKYHFSFARNILEKTATFLGYKHWSDLLPTVSGKPDPHLNRILNLSSHSAHAGEETELIKDEDKAKLKELVSFLLTQYRFKQDEQNG